MAKELIENARRGNLFHLDPSKIVIVGLDDDDGPEHELYDERIKLPLSESMILSVMALGVQQTVRVSVRNGVPLVVDGRQRVRAAREANARLAAAGEPLLTVKVEGENYAKVSPERLMSTMVALNEIRRDDDVLVKAAKADRMRARGIPDKDIAVAFGVTTQTIGVWAKIAALAPETKKAVRDGELSAAAAAQLAGMPREEQKAKLSELLADASSGVKPTVERARAKARPTADGDAPTKPSGRVVAKILKSDLTDLPEGFILALRWMRGEVSAKKIKGLSAVLAAMEPKAKEGA